MTDAEAQVKQAEELVRVRDVAHAASRMASDHYRELCALRRDFQALLEHLDLSFEDVPARRALRPIKGCPESASPRPYTLVAHGGEW